MGSGWEARGGLGTEKEAAGGVGSGWGASVCERLVSKSEARAKGGSWVTGARERPGGEARAWWECWRHAARWQGFGSTHVAAGPSWAGYTTRPTLRERGRAAVGRPQPPHAAGGDSQRVIHSGRPGAQRLYTLRKRRTAPPQPHLTPLQTRPQPHPTPSQTTPKWQLGGRKTAIRWVARELARKGEGARGGSRARGCRTPAAARHRPWGGPAPLPPQTGLHREALLSCLQPVARRPRHPARAQSRPAVPTTTRPSWRCNSRDALLASSAPSKRRRRHRHSRGALP